MTETEIAVLDPRDFLEYFIKAAVQSQNTV